ncbi:MAG TPA: hypothetical protein VGK29_12555 [Paludibaculum sp.]
MLDTRFMGGYILAVGFGLHLQLYKGCPPMLIRSSSARPVHLALVLSNRLGQQCLAFYTGWPNAVTAVGIAKEVFGQK